MSEYVYVDFQNVQQGPVSQKEIMELRARGLVDDETMVCDVAENSWRPYRFFMELTRRDEPRR